MSRRLVTLDESKKIQLEILDEIDSFCSSAGLRYSLAYGSLLGAVRHHGYIPWDDDIDIFMPRPDYEMFLKSFRSEKNIVLDLNTSNECIENFAKVCRKHTFMRDLELGRELWGINVDIFPIDGIPGEDSKKYYDRMAELYSWAPRLCPFYKVVGSGKAKWFLKYIIKRLRFPHKGNCADIKREIRNKLLAQPFSSSPLAGAYFVYGFREFMPREWFEEYTTLEFEGKKYSVISNYDGYLKSVFGNYMELPPVEQRVTHHLYDSFIDE